MYTTTYNYIIMLHPSAYHMRTSFITPWCDNVIFSTQNFNTSFYFILKTSKFNHTASSYTNQILYSFIILYTARDTTVPVSLENKMQAVREVAFGLSVIQYVSDILWMHENAWVMNSRWRHQSIHIYVRTHFFSPMRLNNQGTADSRVLALTGDEGPI